MQTVKNMKVKAAYELGVVYMNSAWPLDRKDSHMINMGINYHISHDMKCNITLFAAKVLDMWKTNTGRV